MFNERRKSHELSERHYRQVLCRPKAVRERMQRVWAITWRPGDRSGSFLGKLFRPLGSPTMMVQASHYDTTGRDAIELFGVAADLHVQDGTVSYEQFRMRHQFHRMPFVGARGGVLDPTDDERGGLANGSWVRLALDVHAVRAKALDRGPLKTIPELPRIYFGYHAKESVTFEVTPELRRRASAGTSGELLAGSFQDIGRVSDLRKVADEQAFDCLSNEIQSRKLHEAFDQAFISPAEPNNGTGHWLLPQELTRNVYATARLYEYFGDLVGVRMLNPARRLLAIRVPNPAAEVARGMGVDLAGDLALLAGTTEGQPEFSEIETRLIGLIPAMRVRLGVSESVTDQQLLDAICSPGTTIAINSELPSLSESEQLEIMREVLPRHVNECCSDADLLAAVREPDEPLWMSGACRIQTLHRDTRIPLDNALSFSAGRLRRERIQAQLCHPRVAIVQHDRPTLPDGQLVATAA